MSGNDKDGLSYTQAELIYDVLVEEVGASERNRQSFVYHQTNGFESEYRFMGSLGFGGKFWRNSTFIDDEWVREAWYVNCYQEHETPGIRQQMDRANRRLESLRQREQR